MIILLVVLKQWTEAAYLIGCLPPITCIESGIKQFDVASIEEIQQIRKFTTTV